MIAEKAERHSSINNILKLRPYTIVATITLVVMGILAVVHKTSEWNETYVGAASALRNGTDFYHAKLKYTYPPFSAWLMLPFSFLRPWLGRLMWYPICAGSVIYLVRTSWRLAGGGAIEPDGSRPAAGPRDQIAFLIGHIVALQLTLNGLTHLQTDALIAALLTAGCVATVAGRYLRAAAWIGVAAAFKAAPLLFAPYLLWKRQWAAAVLLVLVAVGVNLLPNAVSTPPGGGTWLACWCRQYLAPMAKSDYVPGDWQNLLNNNQSLAGAANRWLTGAAGNVAPSAKSEESERNKRPVVRLFFLVLCLVVTGPVAVAFWKRREGRSPSPALPRSTGRGRNSAEHLAQPTPGAIPTVVLEYGVMMLLFLLLSPNSSRAWFCAMYPAAFCVARYAVRPDASVVVRILLAAAAICSTLSIHLRLGSDRIEQSLLWVGVVMFATIFLLFAAVVTLLQNGTFADEIDPTLIQEPEYVQR